MSGPDLAGCDIGGTFTDFVLLDASTGAVEVLKLLTSSADPAGTVLDGIDALTARPGIMARLGRVTHGTTLMINAVVARTGARTGLVTTQGFRDVLEIGREGRYDNYEVAPRRPLPLVPRRLRRGVRERLYADGTVLVKLDEAAAADAIAALLKDGVRSMAVCLLHSYRNPEHERRVRELIAAEDATVTVSLSSEVLPEFKEYERTSTTVVNAYVQPITASYLNGLTRGLADRAFRGDFFVMTSSGTLCSVDNAKAVPVRVIESGPAAGVIAAEHVGRQRGLRDLLSFDMGGTTAKACLVTDGRAGRASSFEIARTRRFVRGSGLPVQIPVVDLLEIGAGGGSIARVGHLGLLEVGPESAGADPGPACYGRGGERPTVTDADLLLGYLNPDYFLGGRMPLDAGRSQEAIARHVATPLGVGIDDAAWRVHSLVNENMAAAARVHLAEKGGDPTRLSLVAFGGAGPVHAWDLACRLEIPRIVVPPYAGVFSCVGFLVAPIALDLARTWKVLLARTPDRDLEDAFVSLENDAARLLGKPLESRALEYLRSVDMRYAGQGSDVTVPIDSEGPLDAQTLTRRFEGAYRALYGRTVSDVPVELVNLRIRATVPESLPRIQFAWTPATTPEGALKGVRSAWCAAAGRWLEHPVYDRYRLPVETDIVGPAIIEERESTTIVGSAGIARATMDGFLTLEVNA